MWESIISRVLKIFGWLLVGAAALAALLALGGAFWIPRDSAKRLGDALSRTSSIIVPAGLLLTLGGLLLAKSHESADAEEKRSNFYLDSCVMAYEQARNLLADGNNDRATWIASARALRHAQRLSTEVSIDAHRRVLDLHRLKYRADFSAGFSEPNQPHFSMALATSPCR